jgi:hypothetical protein
VYDVGRHFEDECNKRNSHLTNPTANVVGLQESLPMVTTFGTFGLPMVIKHTKSNQWKNCERTQCIVLSSSHFHLKIHFIYWQQHLSQTVTWP